LVGSFKLVQRPLDEGTRPKSDKLRLTYIAPLSEGKSIGSERKTVLKESPLFAEPRIMLRPKVQSNSRIQLASNQSKLVPRKLDPGPSSKVCLRIVCKVRKTQHQNPEFEFGHTRSEIEKTPANKNISIHGGRGRRGGEGSGVERIKPSILAVKWVSCCMSFFLSA